MQKQVGEQWTYAHKQVHKLLQSLCFCSLHNKYLKVTKYSCYSFHPLLYIVLHMVLTYLVPHHGRSPGAQSYTPVRFLRLRCSLFSSIGAQAHCSDHLTPVRLDPVGFLIGLLHRCVAVGACTCCVLGTFWKLLSLFNQGMVMTIIGSYHAQLIWEREWWLVRILWKWNWAAFDPSSNIF